VKRLAAVLVSALGFAFTANGYRPLSKGGYGSAYAFSYGVFASELPVQVLGVQLAALAAVSRGLPTRIQRFTWLVSALSWLGLLGLRHVGRNANEPLTGALDAGLGAISMSVRCPKSVPGDGQVAAADGACRCPCGVLVRRCGDGIGAADPGRRAVQVDLGAAHGPERFVLLVPEL
jgi:hypothetical protein